MSSHVLEFEKPITELERELEKLRQRAASSDLDLGGEIAALEEKLARNPAEDL